MFGSSAELHTLRMHDDASIRIRVAVCLFENEEVLLVQHRKGDRSYWLLPGGGVEPGEMLVEAAQRELREETGYEVEVGRLLILCEAIAPAGRHIVNLVFTGCRLGGELRPGLDGTLVGAAWQPVEQLARLETYPPIGREVLACCREGFEGSVRFLGNVWRDQDSGAG